MICYTELLNIKSILNECFLISKMTTHPKFKYPHYQRTPPPPKSKLPKGVSSNQFFTDKRAEWNKLSVEEKNKLGGFKNWLKKFDTTL